jgi:hypothetical protein
MQHSTFHHEIEALDIEVEVLVKLNVWYDEPEREVGYSGGWCFEVEEWSTIPTSEDIKDYFEMVFNFEKHLSDNEHIWLDYAQDCQIQEHEDRIFMHGR